MAGLGFELNKILIKRGYTSIFKAYGYAGLIGSGPWLIAVLCLALLGTVLMGSNPMGNVRLFFVSISWIYACTLILTGPVQMVLNRYAADQHFTNRSENIFPAFIFSLAWVAALFAIIGLTVFLCWVPGPLFFRLAAAMLMVFVAPIWITSVFLTGIKNYHAVLLSFGCGFTSSFLLAWILSVFFGTSGAMFGFALGHAVLLYLLCGSIFQELGSFNVGHPDFLACFKKYWDLALGGLFYNLGIWIDKFLFWWYDRSSEQVAGILYASPIFDRVVYFSFLTIVPGMAVFLMKLETEFAAKNQSFYQFILKKGTLRQVRQAQAEMVESLREGFALMLKVQGLFTGLLILCADKILNLLGLGAVQSGVFEVSLIGAFMLVVFLAVLTILYYLDKRRDALICCFAFTVANGLITAWSISAGERWYGFGFLIAAGIALVMAATMVNHHLQDLDYDTFTSQPIYEASEAGPKDSAAEPTT
jgi:uncharacterized membrane protein